MAMIEDYWWWEASKVKRQADKQTFFWQRSATVTALVLNLKRRTATVSCTKRTKRLERVIFIRPAAITCIKLLSLVISSKLRKRYVIRDVRIILLIRWGLILQRNDVEWATKSVGHNAAIALSLLIKPTEDLLTMRFAELLTLDKKLLFDF